MILVLELVEFELVELLADLGLAELELVELELADLGLVELELADLGLAELLSGRVSALVEVCVG